MNKPLEYNEFCDDNGILPELNSSIIAYDQYVKDFDLHQEVDEAIAQTDVMELRDDLNKIHDDVVKKKQFILIRWLKKVFGNTKSATKIES